MKKVLTLTAAITMGLWAASPVLAQQNLIENGSFSNEENPLAGWVTDYAFAKNNQYMDNHSNVSVVSKEQGLVKVARLVSTSDKGTKMETFPIPFEEGYRYRASLKIKSGAMYRVYFAGYRWKPGVKPNDDPDISELRAVYKSRAEAGGKGGWKTVKLEIPGKKMTSGMKSYLKQIKYITLFVYVTRTSFVDDVVVSRVKDPSMKFD